MPARCPLHRRLLATVTGCFLVAATALAAAAFGTAPVASAAPNTTAWQNGAFSVNTGGVVSESDIFLGQPNTADSQSLPLGNGSLGVAAWAADGFTAQLNRSDTMPYRLSPGQVQIPGLEAMTSAANFTGTLDLYNGVLNESGGGMTMQAWVPAGKDELIVNVTGANPSTQQTADLYLWSGRSPAAAASGAIGSLAQTWVDNSQTGNSGDTFGAMAAITAGGQNVTTSVVNSTEVQVSFTPNSNGSFRVIVAAPEWTGGNATSTASSLIGSDTTTAASSLLATQSSWWNSYWANTGLIQASSSNGSAQYLENLRTIYLYAEAASMHSGDYPGSQAGVADMFAYDEDQQDWYPAGYWLWNLRGQISANMSSGNFTNNIPIFSMYLNDLPAIESWTSAQMGGKAGACVPETMRFNGNGYYNGGNNTQNASCATASSPSYNALNIASGAEIALDIWQQYEDTGSLSFLQQYYPVMEQAATFLLADQSVGSDGFLHAVANAHETQWAVQDPTDDIVADQALFPAVVSAATLLNTDSSLVSQLKTAENEIEPYPRVSQSNLSDLLNSQPTSASAAASDDAGGADAIGDSYQPSATLHNSENIGLEAVWPYGVIGDSTTVNGDNLTALADRTYNSRPNVNIADWSYDAVDAARLDMGSQVSADLVANTEEYQTFISGLAAYDSTPDEPYIEQQSNVATAMDEALATDYDGTLRFAPAWPSGWNGSGTVYIQGGSKVDVQVEGGTIATAAIQAGTTQTMTVRNPWSGQQAEVVNGSSGAVVVGATTASTFSVPVTAGSTYLVEQVSSPTTSLPFAQVTGSQATTAKHLGSVSIGLNGNAPPPVGSGPEAPYSGTAAAVPGTVQAANYDTGGQGVAFNVTSVNGTANSYRSDGVDLEACTDTGASGCGYDLGWTSSGQWFNYTVNVATAGTYTVGLRLSSLSGVTDGLHIANSSGTNLSGNINVPDTGAWQTWTTVNATVTLPAGQQTLTIDQDNGGWNIRTMTFASSATSPGNTVTVNSPGSQTGTVGTAASLQISATDSASGQTLTYSATGLPAGLSISSAGLISGTPTTAATSNVTVTATDTTGASGSASFTWTISGSTTGSCGELAANQELTANQSLASCNGDYTLIMQGDGNLVLYQGSTALWASNTAGTAADEAIMQGDGNFVVYTSSGTALWASGTAGNSGAYLDVQNDGNVVIYSASGTALWSTGTAGK
jgi:putative Ig domain-containing protein/carbohydrate binding protein with CBM6 domain/glycosyl hydrolase family 95